MKLPFFFLVPSRIFLTPFIFSYLIDDIPTSFNESKTKLFSSHFKLPSTLLSGDTYSKWLLQALKLEFVESLMARLT